MNTGSSKGENLKILLLLIISTVHNISCQFSPPSSEVCLGDSISYDCTLNGRFPSQTFFIYKQLLALTLVDLNSESSDGVDLSRISATNNNTQIPNTPFFSTLRSTITLFNISKDDNGTLIGCTSFDLNTNLLINQSDILTLSPPPSPPTLHLTPIPSNCTVMLHWNSPSSQLPITGYTLRFAGSDNFLSDKFFFSDPLTAGENVGFNLTAKTCVYDSSPGMNQILVPSSPIITTYNATYANKTLLITVVSDPGYRKSVNYSLFELSSPTTILVDGSISDSNYKLISNFNLNESSNYNISIEVRLSDCKDSMTLSQMIPVIIVRVTPAIPTTSPKITTSPTIINITTPTGNVSNTTMIPSPSTPSLPSPGPLLYVYIIISVVLVVILTILIVVIVVLIIILRKKKNSKFRSFPAGRLSESKENPDPPEPINGQSDEPESTELHYIEPNFSNADSPPKPQPLPKTQYTDIDHAKSSMEGAHYAYID